MGAVQRISPQEAYQRMDQDGYAYVDVRSVPEFAQGHPTGAYNVPLAHMHDGSMEANPDFMDVMEAVFPRDAKLIVGCKSGGRSLRAAQQLIAAGYTNVVDQRAGFMGGHDLQGAPEAGWSRVGLPTASNAEAGRSYDELAQKAGI